MSAPIEKLDAEESVSVEELADFIFDNECDMYLDTARAILAMFDIKKRS